jgi:STE24 endopeptidase
LSLVVTNALHCGHIRRLSTCPIVQSRSVHTVSAYTLPPDLYDRAVAFANARYALHFAGVAFSALVLYALVRLPHKWRRWPVVVLALAALAGIPLDLAEHLISLHFNISKQSLPSWLWDWTKEQLIAVAIGAVLAWGLYAVIRRSPRWWWLWVWAAMLPLLVLGAYAGPILIEPLFNEYFPLESTHPELIAPIEAMLQRAQVNLPRDRLFEMKASVKTNALNAYVSGFGSSRRLVLYDTIIAQERGDLLLNTIGHELGHNVLGHIPRSLLFAAAAAFPGAWILAWAFHRLLKLHGSALNIVGAADPAGLPALLLLLTLLNFFSEPIANAYSRMQEHDADRFALDVTRGIIPDPGQAGAQAFQLEGQSNLDVPDPDRFIVFWLYSHPPTADRVRFSLEYQRR